jgi:hypothetical protein
MYSGMRDPLGCIDVCVYDGSKHLARHAVILAESEGDDYEDVWDARTFLTDLCTGRPPAQMTIRDLLENQYPWALVEGQHLVVALWTTTEDGVAPDAVFVIQYNAAKQNFNIVKELPQ